MAEPGVDRFPRFSLKVRITLSSIGIFIGLSIAAVFSVQYKNYNTAAWGLCSGIAAAVALGVTIAFMKHAWDTRIHQLRGFMLTGCFVQLAGVSGFIAYLVLAISKQQDLTAYGDGYYLTCVWCFMTWKWGFLLFYYSRSYLRAYMDPGLLAQQSSFGRKHSYDSVQKA